MNSTANSIEISFGSDVAVLDLLQDVADGVSKLLDLDDDATYWIGLSVREAVTNAIEHGNKGDKSREVRLCTVVRAIFGVATIS